MTNREKFKEVFGFAPTEQQVNKLCPAGFDCENVPTCSECPYSERWWDGEYEPTCKEWARIGDEMARGFYDGLNGGKKRKRGRTNDIRRTY